METPKLRYTGKVSGAHLLSILDISIVPIIYMSLYSPSYTALLLLESLVMLVWGIRTHSRVYVQAAILALLANAVAQLARALF